MKEIVSLTRSLVKKSLSTSTEPLRVNRIVLWTMVEDWDDLYKMIVRRILFSYPSRLLDSPYQRCRAPYNKIGRRRLVISGIIAFLLIAADVALIVSQLPKKDIEKVPRLRWMNSGELVETRRDNVINDSFSSGLKLIADKAERQVIRLPSISIERTDYRDFTDSELPHYDGQVVNCTTGNTVRLLCTVQCTNQFYKYKVRMDVSADDNEESYFNQTESFKFDKERVEEYREAIEQQLKIQIGSVVIENDDTRFRFYTPIANSPAEYTNRSVSRNDQYQVEVLTNDAIATIILGSIVINQTEYKSTENEMIGVEVISQTPYIPLLGTLIIYVVLQLFSILLQSSRKLHVSNAEISVLLESVGISCTTNWSNVEVEPVQPHYSYDVDEKGEKIGHIGYLPAQLLASIRRFIAGGPYIPTSEQVNTRKKFADVFESFDDTIDSFGDDEIQKEGLKNEFNVVDKDTFFEFSKFGQKDGAVTIRDPMERTMWKLPT